MNGKQPYFRKSNRHKQMWIILTTHSGRKSYNINDFSNYKTRYYWTELLSFWLVLLKI